MVPEALCDEGPAFLCMAYSRHLSLFVTYMPHKVLVSPVTPNSPCHEVSRTTLFSCPLTGGEGFCTAAGHTSSVPSPEKWVLTATKNKVNTEMTLGWLETPKGKFQLEATLKTD